MIQIPQNIVKKKKGIIKLLTICITLVIITGLYINNATNYVMVRFNELGPLSRNMVVYYNGFNLGRVGPLGPATAYKHTLVKVNLIGENINLPQNTTVFVGSFPNGDLYLQLAYPKSPSLNKMKRGDILEGISPYSLEQFMMGQNISGVTDVVSMHIIKALNSADAANQEIKVFFRAGTDLIKGNEKGIDTSIKNTISMTKNLAQMAENLNQTSKKLNNAVDETLLKNTTTNINDTTTNIKDTTGNISKATKDIDKTMKKVDDTISELNSTAKNLNYMTNGLNGTLSKRFAGIRILFGTPVKPKF